MNIGPTTLNRMSARQAADAVAKQMGPALEETRRIAEAEAAENEKAAPAGTAETTAVNDNPAEHTAAEQRIIEEYKAAVDNNLVAFYENAKNESAAKKGAAPYMLKPANDSLVSDIQRETGVNVSGFDTRLDVRQANHIYKDHGENGKADRTMADANDIGRIQYVLDNYDDVRAWGRTDAYWETDRNGKNRKAKTVLISKKVNGTYYVVEAVPDTKAKSIYVVSAYMLEPGKTPPGNAQKIKTEETQQPNDTNLSSRRYGQTATVEDSSATPTVAQNGNGVKGETEFAQTVSELARAEAELERMEAEYKETEDRFLNARDAEEARRLMPEAEAAYNRLAEFREYVENLKQKAAASVESTPETSGNTAEVQGAETARQESASTEAERTDDDRTRGLVMDQYWRRAYLPSKTSRALDALGEALGVEIRFAEQVTDSEGNAANAMYQDGVITISLDADTPVATAAIHEAVHAVRNASPEAYAELENFVRSAMSGEQLQFNQEVRRRLYGEQSEDYLTEEVVADAFGRMLDDEALLKRFAQDNRTAAQKLRDALRDIVNAVRRFLLRQNKHLTQLQRDAFSDLAERTIAMESLLESAIREAGERGVRMDGEAKFSIKRTSQMTLAEQLKMFYNGKMASSDAFYFGETPAALEKSGFDALPLAMTIGDFRKSTQTKHNIPRRVLKNLMNNLASPLFSFGSGDRAGIILDDIDGDGHKLLAALERGTNMDRKPVNVINSLYGLEHPAEWIKNQIDSGNKFVLYDEKRANAFLQTYGYSASVGDGIRSTGESVTQNGTEVKTKFSLKEDSEGRELTEAAEDLRKEPGTSEQEILEDYVKRYGAIPTIQRQQALSAA